MFKRFTSILLALIMVLGIMPVSVFADGEEASFDEWWANAPKVENFSLSCSPELKNCISTSYADGILTVTISEEADAEVWTKEYLYSCSLGTDQAILGPYIVINKEEAEKNAKISTGDNGILMGFEESSKSFTNGNAVAFGLYAADMVVEENGSAKVYPVGDRLMCAVAWKNGETVSYEYIIVELVCENSSVINIPTGTGIPAINPVHPDWMFFNGDEHDFIEAEYNEENGILEYFYVGENTKMEDIIQELENITIKTYVSPYTIGNTISDIQLEGLGETHLTQGDCSITIPCVVDGRINTWETKAIIIDGINEAARKLTIKFNVNITNMQDKGFSPVPIERMKIGENNANSFSVGGMNVSIGSINGKINVSFDKDVSVDAVEPKHITIEAPDGAVSFKYTTSTGGNCNNIEDVDYEGLTLQYGITGEVMNIKISPFSSKQIEDITYYYTKSYVLHQDYIIVWLDSYNEVISKEYVCLKTEPYSKTETAESVTEEELAQSGAAVTVPTPLSFGKDWKLTCNHFPQHGKKGVYYFELEGDENTPAGDKVIYIPYSFIDENLTYDEAVKLKLSPKLHHYSDNHQEKKLIKDFTLTPYGIRFVISDFSPFVMEWSMDEGGQGGNEGGNAYPPESTPVSDQVLTVYYLHNGKYIKEITRANIVDGKVEITVPYISNSVIDGDVTQARLAFHISNGYSGEGANNITHYMGGFGEDIMDYVNWQDTFASMKEKQPQATYEDFLEKYYWSIGIMGDVEEKASVIKWNVVRLRDNGEIRRDLNGGDTFKEKLYIQYFDANNEKAVAYEHIDLTVNMEYPVEGADRIGFDQVSFNGVTLTDEEFDSKIGYKTGRNGLTDTYIVEMSEEQLLAHKNTADETGTIWARFEFSAPANRNITKFYMAKGEDIENIKNVDLSQFKAYNASNKPMTSQPLGWFEGEEFVQNEEMFGEYKDERCIAWYDEKTGNITYQYFRFAYYMPEEYHEDEGEGGNGGENEGGDQNEHEMELAKWAGKFVEPSQVSLDIPASLRKAITLGFNNETAVVTLDVTKLSTEDWIAAYRETGGEATQITAHVLVSPKSDNIDEAYETNGGLIGLDRFISNSENSNHWTYDEYANTGGWGSLGQIFKSNGKVTIIPSARDSITYFAIAWFDTDTEPDTVTYQIMPYTFEIVGELKSIVFDDVLDYVDENRVVYDSKALGENAKIETSFDAATSKIVYKYNYSGTVDANTPKNILKDLFGQETDYRLVTEVKAPAGYKTREDGYFTSHYLNTNCEAEGGICGHSRTWTLEWELIDKTQKSDSKPEFITEYITVDFDPGIKFTDVLWKPINDISRLTYYRQNETSLEKSVLINGGLTIELANGMVHTGFDTSKEFDIYNVPNSMISIAPPNDGVEYVAFKINESGGGRQIYYDPWMANDQDVMIRGDKFFDITDWRTRCMNLAGFRCETVNGIEVWYTGNAGGEQMMIIDWYTSTEEGAEPAKREYICVRTDDYINEQTADAVTEEELEQNGTAVTTPTPLGENWKLTCNHFPQHGRNDAYYFQLEGDENTPDGDKVIYIPYSFIDENLTYDEAVRLKLKPKLHHYNDDHKEKELIKDFELTPYGIKFIIKDFSPFVLAWTEEEPVAELNGMNYASLSDALTAAESGNTVKLIANVSEEDVFVKTGVTLDLNGFELTAVNNISFGDAQIADNSKGKTGILKAENIVFNRNNIQMPFWTGEGYAFTNVIHQTFIVGGKATENTFALDLRPSFGSKFVEYLKNEKGGSDNNIKIAIRVSWGNKGEYQDFTFSDDLIQRVYSVSGKTLRITVSGVKDIENVTAQVLVLSAVSENGETKINVANGGRTYNFPNDFPVKTS